MGKKKIDYRHILCIVITIGFILCSIFAFSNSLGRIIESGRDFGLSVAYYFCEMFQIPNNISPTVNSLPKIPFFGSDTPVDSPNDIIPPAPIPDNFDDVKSDWVRYWDLFITKSNFFAYLSLWIKMLYYLPSVILLLGGLLVVVRSLFSRYLKVINNDYNVVRMPLKIFKRISGCTYHPIKRFVISFIEFVQEKKYYLYIWLFIWIYNLNLATILLEFFAYYLYIAVTFDFSNIYRQIYKLVIDMSWFPIFSPLIIIIACIVIYQKSIETGYRNLVYNEASNANVVRSLSINSVIYAPPGAGKTSLATDIALTAEVLILRDAYEIILETDMHFPCFPWINLENELKSVIENHKIYDKWSCLRWIREKRGKWEDAPSEDKIFGYEYKRYTLFYNDNLQNMYIWQALEDYACAYLIYTVQSSYIISNYSIRSDKLIIDMGNFPLWDTDFFRRDARLIDSFSRHSHILDFDMLRLGKIMLKNNPNRNAFGFGIYIISEIDKERKNKLELDGVNRNSSACNQKNDLFNVNEKMKRHACIVANRVFLYCVYDLQRTGSLNTDMLELGDNVLIHNVSEKEVLLPRYSPYWFVQRFVNSMKQKFEEFYTTYRNNRSDQTLFLHATKSLYAKMYNYCDRMKKLFGCQTLELHISSGLKDGQTRVCQWFRQSKKIYSKRYATDCLSGIYEERSKVNKIGLDELQEYAEIMASNDELLLQHSHFQCDVNQINKKSEVLEDEEL